MENSIKNRVIGLMESEGLTAGSFAKLIQVNPAAISHILNDRNKPSLEIMTRILTAFPTINSEWLILGRGAMRKGDIQSVSTNREPSLFDTIYPDNQIKEEIKQKESIATENTSLQSTESTVIEKEIIKEVLVQAPQRKLQKVIAYYSDNSFEEFFPA